MRPLRPGSPRPEIIVDDAALRLRDPATGSYVGMPGPFGRERVVMALATNGTGPVWIDPHRVVGDDGGVYLADPTGVLVGLPGVWVARMLDARWVEDTRRLGG